MAPGYYPTIFCQEIGSTYNVVIVGFRGHVQDLGHRGWMNRLKIRSNYLHRVERSDQDEDVEEKGFGDLKRGERGVGVELSPAF